LQCLDIDQDYGCTRGERVLQLRVSKEHAMSLNVGTFDRIARVVIGLALIAFALGYLAPGTGWNWIGWIGVVPILTALFGICPTYRLFGLSTR